VEGRAQKVGGYLDAVVLEGRERLNLNLSKPATIFVAWCQGQALS